MTIAEVGEKCKRAIARVPRDVLILGILVTASTLSFGLGYLAGLDVPVPDIAGVLSPLPDAGEKEALNGEATSAAGQVVASKSGTKYYLPGCAGAERIAEANKVWFASPAAAAAAGYAPAVNCKGL